MFRKKPKTQAAPIKSQCERASGTGRGWEVTTNYYDEYANHPTPWSWTLWENGTQRNTGWASNRRSCIAEAKISKDRIVTSRAGRNDRVTAL